MNKLSHSVLWIVTVLVTACNIQPKQEPIEEVIDRGLKASTEQALLMAKELETQNGRLPKTINKEGKLETSDYSWWCSGFFPGELWYLYEYNPTPEMKKYAEMYTDRVEEVKHITYSHDVGFMLYCSYGNGYRLTGKPEYKDVMLTGANSLATRYDERVGAIRSWDFNKKIWQFPVIIDNMMNLEFFSWASKASGDDRFRKMAISHADKTMLHHFRDDYSCYHVVSYDTITGMPHKKQTHQGAADESAWARGQAWALYGFTMMYRETGKPDYLNHAKHIASFIMNPQDVGRGGSIFFPHRHNYNICHLLKLHGQSTLYSLFWLLCPNVLSGNHLLCWDADFPKDGYDKVPSKQPASSMPLSRYNEYPQQ